MPGQYVASSTATIAAPPDRVWSVITDPEAIRGFMFGTDVQTDWSVGGPIRWRGEWEGEAYEDKGQVLEFDPGRRLVVTHFSPLSGREDLPENYHRLVWTLEEVPGGTEFTLSQDNNETAEAAEHSKLMWDKLVGDVKYLAEHEV